MQNDLCLKLLNHLGFRDHNDQETKVKMGDLLAKVQEFYRQLHDDSAIMEQWINIHQSLNRTAVTDAIRLMETDERSTKKIGLLQTILKQFELKLKTTRGKVRYYQLFPILPTIKRKKTDNEQASSEEDVCPL